MKWVLCPSPCWRDFKEFNTAAARHFPGWTQFCLFIPRCFPELRECRAVIMIGDWTSWHPMMMTLMVTPRGNWGPFWHLASGHPGPIVRCQMRDGWEHWTKPGRLGSQEAVRNAWQISSHQENMCCGSKLRHLIWFSLRKLSHNWLNLLTIVCPHSSTSKDCYCIYSCLKYSFPVCVCVMMTPYECTSQIVTNTQICLKIFYCIIGRRSSKVFVYPLMYSIFPFTLFYFVSYQDSQDISLDLR